MYTRAQKFWKRTALAFVLTLGSNLYGGIEQLVICKQQGSAELDTKYYNAVNILESKGIQASVLGITEPKMQH